MLREERDMTRYDIPRSDLSRLAVLSGVIGTENALDGIESGHLGDELLAQVVAHYALFSAADVELTAAASDRKNKTAVAAAAVARLQMFVRHIWTNVHNRYLRQGQNQAILTYYQLTINGRRPQPSNRELWMGMAWSVIHGESAAIANGYVPIAEPTIAELEVVLTEAETAVTATYTADAAHDEAQAAVAALRPRAMELIREIRATVIFSTRLMDAPSQRRILRHYGSSYRQPAKKKEQAAMNNEQLVMNN